MSDAQIAKDLGRKISDQIDAILKRELRLAFVVLPAEEVVLIYLQLASSFGASAIGTALGARKAELDPSKLYDEFAGYLADAVIRRKEETLQAIDRTAKAAKMLEPQ